MVQIAYIYSSNFDVQNNLPTTYSVWSHNTGDAGIYYGTTTSGGKLLKDFQFGVESASNITSSNWYVFQGTMEYYASSAWGYQSADTTNGYAAFQLLGSSVAPIGGTILSGVNFVSYASDSVSSWYYTGTTVTPGTTIWSGTGSNTPLPCQISGNC
jgi:hypothetical protein